ncbi:MAG: alpha/beta hydrolase [Roseiflexaceae bacterium]|nr:alpha/beta hydrolase [Roseiflexaceae bacterium]
MQPDIRFEHRQIELGAACIHYQMAGAGKPLVLIHGLGGSSRWWRKNATVLAQHFQVYVIDLVGFGQSRSKERFVLAQAAHLLAAWIDLLHLDRVNLIGHSMGGRIAAEFAADFPTRVDRLVLVDAAIVPFGHGYVKQSWGMARELGVAPIDLLRVLIVDTLQAGPFETLRIGREILRTNLSHKLTAIQAPTLIIWGDHDTIVPVQLGKALNEALVGSRLEIIPRAGHIPMWERPAEFNQLILDFLVDRQQTADSKE